MQSEAMVSTAMHHLLQSGVDTSVIALWLGHDAEGELPNRSCPMWTMCLLLLHLETHRVKCWITAGREL